MPRHETAQLNIRSTYARTRVQEIARRTGMTATEIVEDALRGYVPAAPPGKIGTLVRRGPLLVLPATDEHRISLEEAEAALAATREHAP